MLEPEKQEDVEERIYSGPRHWTSGWKGALIAFLLPLLLIAYFLGVFSSPVLSVTEAGPYRYVYLPFKGPYYQVEEQLETLGKILHDKKLPHGEPIGILYDDPRVVAEKDRRGRAGFLIGPDLAVPAGLNVDVVPRREVLRVEVKAHPAIAPIKAYRALDGWLHAHGRVMQWPTVERYAPGSRVITEVPLH